MQRVKTVIEVDGLTHQWEETAAKDNQRNKALERAGFKVIRFTDEEFSRI